MPQCFFQRENRLALVEPVLCRCMPPDMHIALVLLDARQLCILFCQAQDRAITEALVGVNRCAAAFGVGHGYEDRVIRRNHCHAPGCHEICIDGGLARRVQLGGVRLLPFTFATPGIEPALPTSLVIGDDAPGDIAIEQVRNLREPPCSQEVRQEKCAISQAAQGVAWDGCKETKYFIFCEIARPDLYLHAMQPLGWIITLIEFVGLAIAIIGGVMRSKAIESTHDDQANVARAVTWRCATRRRHRQEVNHIFSGVLLWRPGTPLEEPAQGAGIITHGMGAIGMRDKNILEVGGDTVLPEQLQGHSPSSTAQSQSIIDKRTVDGIGYINGATVEQRYTTSVQYDDTKMEGMHVRLSTLSTLNMRERE